MALEAVMHEEGYALLQGYSRDDQEREQRLLEEMAEHRVDGVVLIPSKETRSVHLNRLAALGIPVVLIARRVPGHETDYVGVNNVMAGRLLGEHLAGQGCRRVAFLGGPSRSTARAERQRGLAVGLRRHELTFEPGLAIPTSADRKGGVNAVTALLHRGPLPEGIVCYSDVVAFGVLSGLRAAGVEPGSDVAVASFDDIPEARLQHPPLTSVATYPDLAGTEAARLLLERFEEVQAKPRRVLLKPRPHVRSSSTSRTRTSPSLGDGRQ